MHNSAFLSLELLKEMLRERTESVDIELAKKDIMPFISDSQRLEVWDKDFFVDLTARLKAI